MICSKDIIRLQWLLRDYSKANEYIRSIQVFRTYIIYRKDKLLQEKHCLDTLCILIPNPTLFDDYKNNIITQRYEEYYEINSKHSIH